MERLDKITVKETKTSNFILPLLGFPKLFYQPFLVNAYLNNTDVNINNSYAIHVLVRFYSSPSYINLEEGIRDMDTYIDSYDLFGGKYIMFIIEIPDEFKPDFNKVISGKYSELSREAKRLILKGRPASSSMPQVLSKSSELKEYWEKKLGTSLGNQEVWPILNLRDEIFIKDEFPIKESLF